MPNTTSAAFILNALTLTNTCLTSLVCLTILTILIFGRFFLKDVHLLLCTNTYVTILVYSLVTGSLHLDALFGDLRWREGTNDSVRCRIRGSIVLALLSTIFGAFSLQALFRLCRIVYRPYKRLQKYQIQLLFVAFKWLFSFTFVWFVEIDYLPTEYYCSVPFNTLKPVLLASTLAYGFPSAVIALIYIRIAVYIRCQRLTAATQRRARRDFTVIQRIVVIVSMLWLLGVPSMGLLVYGQLHGGNIHPLTYRIEWVAPSSAFVILSIILVKYDTRLSEVLLRKPPVLMRSHRDKSTTRVKSKSKSPDRNRRSTLYPLICSSRTLQDNTELSSVCS